MCTPVCEAGRGKGRRGEDPRKKLFNSIVSYARGRQSRVSYIRARIHGRLYRPTPPRRRLHKYDFVYLFRISTRKLMTGRKDRYNIYPPSPSATLVTTLNHYHHYYTYYYHYGVSGEYKSRYRFDIIFAGALPSRFSNFFPHSLSLSLSLLFSRSVFNKNPSSPPYGATDSTLERCAVGARARAPP